MRLVAFCRVGEENSRLFRVPINRQLERPPVACALFVPNHVFKMRRVDVDRRPNIGRKRIDFPPAIFVEEFNLKVNGEVVPRTCTEVKNALYGVMCFLRFGGRAKRSRDDANGEEDVKRLHFLVLILLFSFEFRPLFKSFRRGGHKPQHNRWPLLWSTKARIGDF
jgi:hypothetical protein